MCYGDGEGFSEGPFQGLVPGPHSSARGERMNGIRGQSNGPQSFLEILLFNLRKSQKEIFEGFFICRSLRLASMLSVVGQNEFLFPLVVRTEFLCAVHERCDALGSFIPHCVDIIVRGIQCAEKQAH